MFKRLIDSPHLEIFIAIMIALASTTTALVTWRASMAGSEAGDVIRQGLIDAVKKQAATNEDWRVVYERARYAQTYAVTLAQVEAYEKSGDNAGEAQAAAVRQYLLPNLQLLSEPLGTDKKYLRDDGTYDLEMYFADLQSESPDMAALDLVTNGASFYEIFLPLGFKIWGKHTLDVPLSENLFLCQSRSNRKVGGDRKNKAYF